MNTMRWCLVDGRRRSWRLLSFGEIRRSVGNGPVWYRVQVSFVLHHQLNEMADAHEQGSAPDQKRKRRGNEGDGDRS